MANPLTLGQLFRQTTYEERLLDWVTVSWHLTINNNPCLTPPGYKASEFNRGMCMFNIDAEHDQLIATWKSTLSERWLTEPKTPVRALIDPAKQAFGMSFRHAHNIFGWKAGDRLDQRGLCSGAIYRTEAFMETPQGMRSGTKGPARTIHIEHTVPIAELNRQWIAHRQSRLPDIFYTYAWLFAHSISTALHIGEMGGVKGYESKTEAFNEASIWFNRPFVRYNFKDTVPPIWNVLTGEKVDIETWSFNDHFEQILTLLFLGGCAEEEIERLRDQAKLFIPDTHPREMVRQVA